MYGAFCYVCLWEYTWLVQEHAPVQLSCGCVACRRCVCWWLRGQVGCPQPECWNGHPIVGMVATTEADALTDTLAMLPETGPAAPEQPTHAAPPSEAAFSAGRLPLEFLTVTGECLGVGGAGTVYGGLLQLLEGTKLPVAVKTDTAPEHGGRRMRREIVIAMHISQACPLTCRVYGYVEQGDQLLMVMERCQRSLAGRLAELGGRGLPQGELARVAVDLCTSLAQLHACGVVHSDIKPGNCLVRADERGTVVLADFGACKARGESGRRVALAVHACTMCGRETEMPQCVCAAERPHGVVDHLRDALLRLVRALVGPARAEARCAHSSGPSSPLGFQAHARGSTPPGRGVVRRGGPLLVPRSAGLGHLLHCSDPVPPGDRRAAVQGRGPRHHHGGARAGPRARAHAPG